MRHEITAAIHTSIAGYIVAIMSGCLVLAVSSAGRSIE